MRSRVFKKEELNRLFIQSIGDRVSWHSAFSDFPFECDLDNDSPKRLRVYLYTITRQHGGRPQDEYKIQVILPGHKRHSHVRLDASDDRFPLLGGFSIDFEAFAFWDATLYFDFSYSRNMQIRELTLAATYSSKVATQERLLRQGNVRERERIFACQSHNLGTCIDHRLFGVSV